MDLIEVMQELTDAVGAIDGLRAYPWYADRITPPAALVSLPTQYNFDGTYARGMDRLEVAITVLVARTDLRSGTLALSEYAAGSGDSSVKRAIEDHTSVSYDSARVTRIEFDEAMIASVTYVGAIFYVDVVGSGG